MMRHLPFSPLASSTTLALALGLSACGTATRTSTITRPDVAWPDQFSHRAPAAQLSRGLDAAWWQGFGSAQLSQLVQEALAGSPDLRVAAERVRQAQAQLGNAQAARLPSANLGGSTSSRRADGGNNQPANASESTSASLSISYEVDLWGKVAASIDGAQAAFQGSQFDAEAARLSLIANLANTYFQVLSLSARLETAQHNLDIAERVLKVVQARNRNGVATGLDLVRQQTTVLTQRTALVPLETQLQQQRAALAVLLGRVPQGFALTEEKLAALSVPRVSPGLPSDLLWRRPDLARTEADLRGAQANIVVAKAALLPSFSLSGSGGLGTAALLSLANPSSSLGWTASLAYSLFDGGRQQAGVTVAESQRRVVLESSRKTILTALKEVEDALGNTTRYQREERAQQELVQQSRLALKTAELRYREGVDDLLTVLDTQRTLFQAEDQLLQVKLSRLTATVDLYKALGGDWQSPSAPTAAPSSSAPGAAP